MGTVRAADEAFFGKTWVVFSMCRHAAQSHTSHSFSAWKLLTFRPDTAGGLAVIQRCDAASKSNLLDYGHSLVWAWPLWTHHSLC